MSGAVIAKVPAEPLPPISADHGRTFRADSMYEPGLAGFGWAVMAGGGYQDFTRGDMRNLTGTGGAWSARVVGGLRSYLGFEAAYVGSARGITALGQVGNSTLVSNGFEGTLRVNAPFQRGSSLLEPYGFIGLGWSRYGISNYNATLTSDFSSGANVMTMPFGAGFAYAYRGFIADARFTYTATYFDTLLQSSVTGANSLNSIGAGGELGFMF